MDCNHNNNTQRARDVVYCHECENEWYRDEHGLTCPECRSDFTEIVEPDHDPRQDEQHIPPDHASPGDSYASDPEEDHIDDLRVEETGPGRYRVHGTYRGQYPMGAGQQQQGSAQGGVGAGLMGMVGNMLQGMIAPQQQQQGQHGQQPQNPNAPGRPASASGQQPGTFVRTGGGSGFSYTIASTSNANVRGNLQPRNANAPQPFQPQPDQFENMMAQMMANIGAMPGHQMVHLHGPQFQQGAGMQGAQPARQPFMMGGPQPGFLDHFTQLLNSMGGPPGGIAGDAVYSQEGLDRIITQLMEQHTTGNAPPPASEAAINSLPTREISQKDLGENGKAECSICMDEVLIGGTVTVLPCQHWFHHECIKAWLGEHDTCPHCRQGIMPKDNPQGVGASGQQPRSPSQAPLHDTSSPAYAMPAPPGAFPFQPQNVRGGGGDGSMQNPLYVPDSPTMNRRRSTDGDRRRSGGNGGSSGSGMFGRMRDAFGSGRDGSGSASGGRG